jgi:hypothetical protein
LGLAIRAAHKKYCIPNSKNKFNPKEDCIVILVFAYIEKSETDPLKNHIKSSVDVTKKSQEERLRKIVHYFSSGTRPRSDTNVERQKDRKTERQKDRKTERQKDRKTERQRNRETKRQRDRARTEL